MNSNIFMDNSQILPCNKQIKWVKNKNFLQLLSNFVKITPFSELCVIYNKIFNINFTI